jgi:hypothetical protein
VRGTGPASGPADPGRPLTIEALASDVVALLPFIAGSGKPLLPGITTTHLDLAEVNEVGNGVVVLTYKPKR